MIIKQQISKVPNINNGYIIRRDKSRIKKPETASWQKSWELLSLRYREEFKNFNRKIECIEANIIWYNPNFFTKKEEVSKNAGDIDGIYKFIFDGIFSGIGLDDSLVKKKKCVQLPTIKSSKHTIVVEIKRISISDLVDPTI